MKDRLSIVLLGLLSLLLSCRDISGQTTDINHKVDAKTSPTTRSKVNIEESVRGDGWTPEVVVHMLSLLEQLHVKFAGWEVRIAALEKQVSAVRNRVGEDMQEVKSQVVSVEQRLAQHSDTVRDTVSGELKEVKGQITSTEQRLAAQVESIRSSVNLLEQRLILGQSPSQKDPVGEKLLMRLLQGKEGQQFEKVKDVQVNTSGLVTQEDLAQFSEYIVTNVSGTMNAFREEIKAASKKTLISNNSSQREILSEFSEKIEKKIEAASFNCCMEITAVLDQRLPPEATVSPTPVSPTPSPEPVEDIKPNICERNMNVTEDVVVVYPGAEDTVAVPHVCDTESMGGGWVVIQRRQVGELSFYRGWKDYLHGFGDTSGDLWIGLEAIRNLTRAGGVELLVNLSHKGENAFAYYTSFQVGDESTNYAITVSGYSGTAGDSLTMHNGYGFTTYDHDNDNWYEGNCAISWTGAWWYGHCHNSNLNGMWLEGGSKGLQWRTFTGYESASSSVMMLRPLKNNVGHNEFKDEDYFGWL